MNDRESWRAVHIDDVEEVRWRGMLWWRPLRQAIDTRIIGMAAYSANVPGEEVIEGHTESQDGRGHEEVYVVLKGSVRFTLDDCELDAGMGTFVRAAPDVYRRAVASEPNTVVLALGGDPTFEPSAAEWIERARPVAESDPDAARRIIDELRQAQPESVGVLVGDALVLLFEGDEDRARELVARVVEQEPALRETLEHIGSTAVPGLAAKPVIDVLVTVDDPDDESTLLPAFGSGGYELRVREPGHRMFRTPERDVHVHVWADANPQVDRCLAFRDRLRHSPEDRAAYGQLKRYLATREWSDTNEYADAKIELISAIITRADSRRN